MVSQFPCSLLAEDLRMRRSLPFWSTSSERLVCRSLIFHDATERLVPLHFARVFLYGAVLLGERRSSLCEGWEDIGRHASAQPIRTRRNSGDVEHSTLDLGSFSRIKAYGIN